MGAWVGGWWVAGSMGLRVGERVSLLSGSGCYWAIVLTAQQS